MKTYKVELTEDFIKKAHAVACPDWKTKIKDLVPEAFKYKFEVGKWYKLKQDLRKPKVLINYRGGSSGYGINNFGKWESSDYSWSFKCSPGMWQPATDKEVEEALIQEAKKRGLVPGCSFKSHWVKSDINNIIKSYETKNCSIVYNSNENELTLESSNMIFTIFKDGVWAEHIENPTLKRIEEIEAELKLLKSKL